MKKGQKFDKEKPRWDLIPLEEVQEVVEVLTEGAKKYADDNWKLVRPFHDRYFAAAMRHLEARKRGQVSDEDGNSHLAHAATNIIFMMYGDKKRIDISEKNIALDIDEVLADYIEHHLKYYNTKKAKVNRNSYGLYYGYRDDLKTSLKDEAFWMSIPKLIEPEQLWFEPKCYITTREIPLEWTEEWIAINKFPVVPIVQVKEKGKACVKHGIDIMVDDSFTHFIDINNHGVKCYLFDRPHNKKYDVGELRLKDFKDLI